MVFNRLTSVINNIGYVLIDNFGDRLLIDDFGFAIDDFANAKTECKIANHFIMRNNSEFGFVKYISYGFSILYFVFPKVRYTIRYIYNKNIK